jgi:hypothetical protein
MVQKISQLTVAAASNATDQLEASQLSTTVLITAATISAAAADNSYNDSALGFVAAGFAVGDQVSVAGFTGSGANNIYSATVTALTTGKMTIGGTDGDVIVDDAAGETVTITKWISRRLPISMLLGPAVQGPASAVDNTLPRFDTTTGKLVQASGVLVSDADELSAYKANINSQTGTTYTVAAADSGKIVDHSNAGAIAVTLPNSLPKGFLLTYVQAGAGAITFSAEAGGTLSNRLAHTKTAGQHAAVTLFVRSNSGTNAAWVMCGDTAAP